MSGTIQTRWRARYRRDYGGIAVAVMVLAGWIQAALAAFERDPTPAARALDVGYVGVCIAGLVAIGWGSKIRCRTCGAPIRVREAMLLDGYRRTHAVLTDCSAACRENETPP